MTDLRTAAQQALEYLDAPSAKLWPAGTQYRIITALRAALAQQAEPVEEPVAWLVTTEMQDGTRRTYPMTGRLKDAKDACDFGEPVPLYTAPPQRKPLTEEQISALLMQAAEQRLGALAFARAVERAHGIGGQE